MKMTKDFSQDDMDKSSIDQLHNVVLQLAGNCFEIKKLCATILVSASVLIATFTQKEVDISIFIGAACVICTFWILDSQSYFYQEKLRLRMKELANNIVQRNQETIVVGSGGESLNKIEGVGMPLSDKRKSSNRFIRSLFNGSMLFYLILAILDFALLICYLHGFFGAHSK